ncbi:50S ribosomal protein L25 [Candidatus Gottesmanbacteria bacterium]|nr:50S ribosomal protein L25 [Candidatus Gottesmanbacteria bacterium]
MEKLQLKATKRTITGRKVKKLRKEGILPANIYGKKLASIPVQVLEKDFSGVFNKAGETGLVELIIESKKHPVLIQNIQYHPVTHYPLHADFYQVDLKEKVSAKVPLVFISEAPAVKDKVGTLLQLILEVEVEALPADLPDKIEVDVGKLSAVDQSIKVGELKVDSKIKILTLADLEIVKVAPLVSKEAEKMAKEQAEAAAAAAAAAAPAAATGTVAEEKARQEETVSTTEPAPVKK